LVVRRAPDETPSIGIEERHVRSGPTAPGRSRRTGARCPRRDDSIRRSPGSGSARLCWSGGAASTIQAFFLSIRRIVKSGGAARGTLTGPAEARSAPFPETSSLARAGWPSGEQKKTTASRRSQGVAVNGESSEQSIAASRRRRHRRCGLREWPATDIWTGRSAAGRGWGRDRTASCRRPRGVT
jgi:hypothetical protein